jgi:polyhydroxybutyrate depolymerase
MGHRLIRVPQRVHIRWIVTVTLLAFGIAISDARADLSPGMNVDLSLVHDGQNRLYDVLVPASYDGSVPVPLVVDMHGFTADRAFQQSVSGFDGIAETEGFLVAWPLGLFADGSLSANTGGPAWNAGGCCGEAVVQNIDDVGFIRTMVEAITSEANIDPRRIYATGHSNGGMLTHRLACEAADLFAAAASFSYSSPFVPCAPSRLISIFMVHSRTDLIVPYAGGPLAGTIIPSAPQGFEDWRTRNRCTGSEPNATEIHGDTSECGFYTTCADGVEVGLCSVNANLGFISGHMPYFLWITDGFNSEARVWEFLSHAVPEPHGALSAAVAVGAALVLGCLRRSSATLS